MICWSLCRSVLGSASHDDAVDALSNTTIPLDLGLSDQTQTERWGVIASAIQLGYLHRVCPHRKSSAELSLYGR